MKVLFDGASATGPRTAARADQPIPKRLVLLRGAEVDTSTKPASRGREDELRSLVEAVSQHRLVTITGPPGVGK